LKTHHIIFWFDNRQEEQKLAGYLQEHGYHCTSCRDRNHFDQLIDTQVSLAVIDLNIKETDAILACNEIKSRKNKNNPSVIIVSDKEEEYTQVTALDLGADDYILKPVKPQLFLKRAEAILSRKRTDAPHKNGNASGLTIDKERYVVMVDNSSYELPRKEFELINLFYSVPNKIFTREEIAIALWKEEKIAKQRTIDVHIRNIRRILGKNLIKTVKGFGYGLNKVAGIL
jgi:two-component system alkaline phosphatase synthesis response regulator PhoP